MTEIEMLKELRIIVARVAHADQASGRAPAHVLQAKLHPTQLRIERIPQPVAEEIERKHHHGDSQPRK